MQAATAPAEISALVARFRANYAFYKTQAYNETQLRREFLDPFFHALGWDVANTTGTSDFYKDVIHEDSIKISGATKAPDYSFRVGARRQFFVEAKRPSKDLRQDPLPAFQLRRYAWSAKLPISILTDFEEMAIYDGRIEPSLNDGPEVARVRYLSFEEYEGQWDWIAGTFSKEAVLDGAFDAFAEAATEKRGRDTVDVAFLRELERWRLSLAIEFRGANDSLSQRQLNFAVQRTIDRIIFLRICEDRGIEPYGQLQELVRTPGVYDALTALFRRADSKYNSGLFHFGAEIGREEQHDELTPGLRLPDAPLRDILERLYYPTSPYEFSVLPADILGQAYEQFLGRVIVIDADHTVTVEDKPIVKKAGGVYYTPTFVVDHIVAATLGPLLAARTPAQIAGTDRKGKGSTPLRILDPSCGSGSFLIAAYQHLLDWYRDAYIAEDASRHSTGRSPRLYQAITGEWRLTGQERQRILLTHIFGVDIDAQAVEVTKLSLLLKVLEGESLESIDNQMAFFHERALPDLGRNIKCGNSLIGSSFFHHYPKTLEDGEAAYRVNAFDWADGFADVLEGDADGFDVVIGNPPYVLLQDGLEDAEELAYFRSTYEVASYKVDTYHLFMEKGVELTRPGGRCSMITPANFLTNNYLDGLRRYLLEHSTVERIEVIDGGVFEGISVDNAIFVVSGGPATEASFPVAHCLLHGQSLIEHATTTVDPAVARASAHTLFTGAAEQVMAELWDRLDAESIPLGGIAHVNFGKQLRDRAVYARDVITVADEDAIPSGYRACLTGRDIARYRTTWSGLACLNDREAKRGGCWDDDRQNSPRKILTRQIGRHPEFALDESGRQCLNTMFMINVHDHDYPAAYVLGVLNSALLRTYWLDRFYDQRRTFPKIKGTYLKLLPIWPRCEPGSDKMALQEQIAEAAQQLMAAFASDPPADERAAQAARIRIDQLERRVDEAVNALYDVPDALAEKLAQGIQPRSPAARQ